MSLPIPVVGVAPGPDWASLIDSCLTILDGHSHVPGSGVPITPSAMNINADLTMASNNLTNARSLRMAQQLAALSLPADLDCLYDVSGDLYFNDGAGNQIRLTQSGSIVGTAGSITGLPSGTASASYTGVGATFVWQSATNVAANMDFRNAILRNSTASSFGLTLQPPSGMGANYSLTLPVLPGSAMVLSLDASGIFATGVASTVATNDIAPAAVTRPKLAAVGQVISSSCGTATTTSSVFALVTNMTNVIVTTGRPVMMFLQPDGSTATADRGYIQALDAGQIRIKRDGTVIAVTQFQGNSNLSLSPGAVQFMDTNATAASHTYTVEFALNGSTSFSIINCVFVTYELA